MRLNARLSVQMSLHDGAKPLGAPLVKINVGLERRVRTGPCFSAFALSFAGKVHELVLVRAHHL